MTAKRMRENQLGDKNRLQGATNVCLFFEACLLTIDHFYLRLLFICERYFDQKWSKKEENHLNDFRVRSSGKCISIDHWDCFHRRF